VIVPFFTVYAGNGAKLISVVIGTLPAKIRTAGIVTIRLQSVTIEDLNDREKTIFDTGSTGPEFNDRHNFAHRRYVTIIYERSFSINRRCNFMNKTNYMKQSLIKAIFFSLEKNYLNDNT